MGYSKILIFKYLLHGFGHIYFIMLRSKGYVLLVAKQKKAWRTVYKAKWKTERKRSGKVMRQVHQKYDAFKIAKRMVKTIQDIICEQCIRNDDAVLAISDEDNKTAWKSYPEKLLNTEFVEYRNTLSHVDPVSVLPFTKT